MLAAVAMALPISGVAAAPVGAVAGTRCGAITGTAQFHPALPVISKKQKVVSTVTSTGTFKHCSGGGVVSGTFNISYKMTGNCASLLAYSATPTNVRINTTWNTNQTSTASVQLHPVKSAPTKRTVTGTITAGRFTGLHTSTTFSFAFVTKGGCLVTHLKEASISGGPLVVK